MASKKLQLLSDLADKNTYASINEAGVIKLHGGSSNKSGIVVSPEDGAAYVNTSMSYGTTRTGDGKVVIAAATEDEISAKSNRYKPIVPATLNHVAAAIGLGDISQVQIDEMDEDLTRNVVGFITHLNRYKADTHYLNDGSDLAGISASGVYKVGNMTGLPSDVMDFRGGGTTLIVAGDASDGYYTQTLIAYGNNDTDNGATTDFAQIFTRQCYQGESDWPWVKVVDNTPPWNDISSTEPIVTLEHDREYRYTTALTSLEILIPTAYTATEFISSIVFTSGDTATNFTAPSEITFTGVGCIDGVFVPVANTEYEVCIWWNGLSWKGLVA